MNDNLTLNCKTIEKERLTFDDLRNLGEGEVAIFQFPLNYPIQKARNMASMYKSYYKDGKSFSITDLGEGRCKISRNS